MLCAANIAGLWFSVLCLYFVSALQVPAHFADARLIMVDGYPPGWAKHYFEQAFDADPVMAYCAQNVVPICWSDLVLGPASKSERMVLKAATFGLLFPSGRASAEAHPLRWI